MKRLLIYFFYDKSGIVDDYVCHMLESLCKFSSEIMFVSNGQLEAASSEKIKSYVDNVICRENKGYDVYAYKEAMQHYGWDKLAEYDEVILMNYTIMGPVYPFDEMFSVMEKKQVDFWGITKGYEEHNELDYMISYGYTPEHIQSHFIVVCKNLLKSDEFRKYWDNIGEVNSYHQSICKYEAVFTKYFEDLGFKSAAYIDDESFKNYVPNPLVFSPVKLIDKYKCPIFKRKIFFLDYHYYLNYINGEAAYELINYLKDHTNYNIDFIWDNILRTANQFDIKNSLHLNYVVPSNVLYENKHEKVKVALMMHIYFEDLADYCADYASHMPKEADIYITTNTESKKAVIEKSFSKLPNKVLVVVIENRGRDVSSLLVALREYVYKYDVICYVHDKKVGQLQYSIKGESFSYQCFENILKSKDFVSNVITLFQENKRLGMLVPPPPLFADYKDVMSYSCWTLNFDGTRQFLGKIGVELDMDIHKDATAPYGTMFWFRSKALLKLLDINLKYEDFEAEPASIDGSLMHIIERAYPFIVQYHGYYPAWVLSDTFAKIQLSNFSYMYMQNVRQSVRYAANADNNMVALEHVMSLKEYILFRLKRFVKGRVKNNYPKIYDIMYKVKNKIKKGR